MNTHPEIKAKGKPEYTSLYEHLDQVRMAVDRFASYTGHHRAWARWGALLHDIGKAHPVFQQRLKERQSDPPFRHELASLFFLSLVPEAGREAVIEMVVGHHKAIRRDRSNRGILDLLEEEPRVAAFHLGEWEVWSSKALDILAAHGLPVRAIPREEALDNFEEVVDFCEAAWRRRGYSSWRGLLMGADHFASAMIAQTEVKLKNLFVVPDLRFFNRESKDYPLSRYPTDSERPHTMVVASTGAGKTDFLFRRCRGRVFYTLPFQASINAMYFRLKEDLGEHNPELNLQLLHAASSLVGTEELEPEDVALRKHIGASVKVLTPYQLVGLLLGSPGYEALLLDVKGCDIIFDEVHTYAKVSQALILRLLLLFQSLGCRLHIGTATMSSLLYQEILKVLGPAKVLETKLTNQELDGYNRHRTHKVEDWEKAWEVVRAAVQKHTGPKGLKILLVLNRVKWAQDVYRQLAMEETLQDLPRLLLHSRFKRQDRRNYEELLIEEFNKNDASCIVVSTQVVEVSLDISFDLMVSDCAPLDALIQRFGRINRKRDAASRGRICPVYIVAPPADSKVAKPYDLDILQRSYGALPDGEILEEKSLQQRIDTVFTDLDIINLETLIVYKATGNWSIPPLGNGAGMLVKLLDIDSVRGIVEEDITTYTEGDYAERMGVEISVRYYKVKHLQRLTRVGNEPYIFPNHAYDPELGLQLELLQENQFDETTQFL